MHQLVNDHVLKALKRLLGKLGVESDASGARIARSPTSPHSLHEYLSSDNSNAWLPLHRKNPRRILEFLAIPGINDGSSRCEWCTGTNLQNERPVSQLDARSCVCIHDLQQTPATPNEVTLAVDELAWRLALLNRQASLLLSNPTQLGDDKEAKRLQIHSYW